MGWWPSWGARHPRLVRWAAILLPFVLAARAWLLVQQLHSERDARRHADDPPGWPVQPGEVLRFGRASIHSRPWTLGPWERRPLVVGVTRKDFLDQPPDTGCMIDPPALARSGGTLTFMSQDAAGFWRTEWSGGPTIAAFNSTQPLPAGLTRVQAMAVHDAEDCGTNARLVLSNVEALALVNFLAGQPPPPPDPSTPRRVLTIRVDAPPPG